MSRAVSMRRLVSVSSTRSPSGDELVQGDVVLDVFGDEHAILLRHRSEVAGGEHRIGRKIGELPALDDVTDSPTCDVGFKVALDGRDGGGLFGLVISDKLGELFFEQLILGLEARDETEYLLKDLAQGQAAVR